MTPTTRPLIGITAGSCEVLRGGAVGNLPAHYIDRKNPLAVVKAGGDPVILPAVGAQHDHAAERYADQLDGFVLSGGADITPSAYGGSETTNGPADRDPPRDNFELALVRAVRERRKPVLGVCRGMQVLNVAFGGTLAEVRHGAEPAPVDGFSRVVEHRVELKPGSLVADVYESHRIDVWCLHHQAPDTVGESLVASGRSVDGIIEAIEGNPEEGFLLGVLFHPEFMFGRNPEHVRPYRALVEAACERARGEEQEVGLNA